GALTLEIAAGDLARRIIAFLVIHGEREEIHALFRIRRADHGRQHDGFAIGGEHGAVGLACDLAGLEGQRAAAPFEAFFLYVEHLIFFRHCPPPDRGQASSWSPYGTSICASSSCTKAKARPDTLCGTVPILFGCELSGAGPGVRSALHSA